MSRKGSFLVAIFANKALQDTDLFFNKKIRFIFDTDKDTLCHVINKYVKQEKMSSMVFAPATSKFQIIYAKKRLLQLHLEAKNETNLKTSKSFSFNTIHKSTLYQDDKQNDLVIELKKLDFDFNKTDKGIEVIYKNVHSQTSHTGTNTINRLAIALINIGITSKTINFINKFLANDLHSIKIFGDVADQYFGKLTFS